MVGKNQYIDDLLGDETDNKKPRVGRPPIFETAEELQAKIHDYFDLEIAPKQSKLNGKLLWTGVPILTPGGNNKTKKGEVVYKDGTKQPVMSAPTPPTVAGLALYLGFADYRSIYRAYYTSNPDMHAAINMAIARIAAFAQQQLFVGQSTGAIFWLKNHGWADTIKTEHTGRDGGAIETDDVTGKNRNILQHFIKNYKDRA